MSYNSKSGLFQTTNYFLSVCGFLGKFNLAQGVSLELMHDVCATWATSFFADQVRSGVGQ